MYILVGSTVGGLFVLSERLPPYEACVLNPFTGAIVLFHVSMSLDDYIIVVAVTESPMMIFVCSEEHLALEWADETSPTNVPDPDGGPDFGEGSVSNHNLEVTEVSSITTFGGELYALDLDGSILLTKMKGKTRVCNVKW
jgi:hypothetical protein